MEVLQVSLNLELCHFREDSRLLIRVLSIGALGLYRHQFNRLLGILLDINSSKSLLSIRIYSYLNRIKTNPSVLAIWYLCDRTFGYDHSTSSVEITLPFHYSIYTPIVYVVNKLFTGQEYVEEFINEYSFTIHRYPEILVVLETFITSYGNNSFRNCKSLITILPRLNTILTPFISNLI